MNKGSTLAKSLHISYLDTLYSTYVHNDYDDVQLHVIHETWRKVFCSLLKQNFAQSPENLHRFKTASLKAID